MLGDIDPCGQQRQHLGLAYIDIEYMDLRVRKLLCEFMLVYLTLLTRIFAADIAEWLTTCMACVS
jgi:hypothetical protein